MASRGRTILGESGARLRRLQAAARPDAGQARVARLWREVAACAGDRTLRAPPRWSCMTDDGSPVELSVTFRASGADVRVLVEPQADPPSPGAYWRAGLALLERLEAGGHASLDRFRRVADLFVPTDAGTHWAMWQVVEFRRRRPPLCKVYLNPAAQGVRRTTAVLREALERLGFRAVWPTVRRSVGPDDDYTIFSLDLSAEAAPRTKLYVLRRRASVARLEAAHGLAEDTVPGDVRAFCRAIVGRAETLWRRPVLTSYYLTPEAGDRPVRAALQIPLVPYVANDRIALDRIRRFLGAMGLPGATYARCVAALRAGPLGASRGLHSWVALQRESGTPRVTTYFNPRIYHARYGFIGLDPLRAWPAPFAPGLRHA